MRRALPGLVFLATLSALLLVPFHPDHLLVRAALNTLPADDHAGRRLLWNLIESGGNLLAFAAAAVALRPLVRRWWHAAIGGALLSAGAELAQIVIPNRVASLQDFVTNAIGALAGAALTEWVRHRRAADESATDRPPLARPAERLTV